MKILFTVFGHVLRSVGVLMRPVGVRSLVAENLILKQQLMVLIRGRKLSPMYRLMIGLWGQLLSEVGMKRVAVI